MLLRYLNNRQGQPSPENIVPVAMMLIAAGMSILVIGIVWPRFLFAAAGPGWNDFLRGLTYGIAIALEVCGLALSAAAAAAAAKRKQL